MFRKPIRTYQRKKGGVHSTTSGIIRENIPPDRDAEMMESLGSDTNDEISDPFDTTFDRVAKTAKMPPRPPADDSESSYDGSSSSSSGNNVTTIHPDVPPILLPLINPEPVVKRERVFRRRKTEKDSLTKVTGRLRKPPKRLGRRISNNSLNDENMQPNVNETADETKRAEKQDAKYHEKTVKKQQILKKRTPMAVYRGRRQKNLDNSKSQHNSETAESAVISNIGDDVFDNRTIQEDESSIPKSSKDDENKEQQFGIKGSSDSKIFGPRPSIIENKIPSSTFKKKPEIFKTPMVSLARLHLPEQYSIGDNSWLSSTPISQRPTKTKSGLHFSPINNDVSMINSVRHGDKNSGDTSLPPKSSNQVVNVEFKEYAQLKDSDQSSEKTEEKTQKRRAIILSDSPAPDPSCLMFEDTDTPEAHSSFDAAAEENLYTAGPAYSSKKCENTTHVSSKNLLKGCSFESSDAESLHLQYDAVDQTESSSENLVQSSEKIEIKRKSTAANDASLVVDENSEDRIEGSANTGLNELTDDSSDAEFTYSKTNVQKNIHSKRENNKESSLEHIDNLNYLSHQASQERATMSVNTLNITDSSTNDSTKDISEKFHSDSEWSTIPDCSEASASYSTKTDVLLKDLSKIMNYRNSRQDSIEQLSSNDENISSDDTTELVNANNSLLSDGSSHVDGENVDVDTDHEHESKTMAPFYFEEANQRDSSKDYQLKFMKPIVLLEQLVLPPEKVKRKAVPKKMNVKKSSKLIELTPNSILNSNDDDVLDVETPVLAKKSRKIDKVKKSTDKNSFYTININRNSIESPADRPASSTTKISGPARKSIRNKMGENIGLLKPSEIMESSQHLTLNSTSSITGIDTPDLARKSGKTLKGKKANAKNRSVMTSLTHDSIVDLTNSSVSSTETPVLPTKLRRRTKRKKTELLQSSDRIDSSQHSTLSSANSSVSDTKIPVPTKKSQKTTVVDNFDMTEESKNVALNSLDIEPPIPAAKSKRSASDSETQIPTRRTRKNAITKKTRTSNRVHVTEPSQKSTQSSIDDNDVDAEFITSANKSRKSMIKKKDDSVNRLDTTECGENSTMSSTDHSLAPTRKLQKTTRNNKRRIKTPSVTSDSSHNSTLNPPDEHIYDIDMELPFKKSRNFTQAKRERVEDSESMNTDAETPENYKLASVTGNAEKELETPELSISELSDQKDSSKRTFSQPIANEVRASRSLSSEMENKQIEKTRESENELPSDNPPVIETYENPRRSVIQPVVLLTRLNDPVRVSLRRHKKISNLYSQLNVIPEDLDGKSTNTIEIVPEKNETSESYRPSQDIRESIVKLSGEDKNSQQSTNSCGTLILSNTIDESRLDRRESRLLYLKPGKSWARSLSILSNVHSQEDLESLAVGKGKKWRESVNNILQMQQQGLLQSCVKKNENDKESSLLYGVRNSAAAWNSESSQSDTSRVLSGSSPGKFVRRVSIRVVPDCTNVERIEDTSFREAYGITAFENWKTIGKRSTSIVPGKTLVYNVQNVSYDNIPKNINTVKSKDVVLRQCCQDTSLPFEECYPLSYLKKCRKIGEGVYGEVFLYEKATEKTVIKIIPIEGDMNVNNERQKRFDEILSEIVIAKELHNLRFAQSSNTSSFVEVKNVRCVAGKYPRKLIELWNTYDEEKNSENDCPVMFDDNQLYIILELGHGGEDLEAFVFQNASESYALFMQTAVALAVAEEKLDFEHRDLHWGNILIARTNETHVEYKLRDKTIRLPSKGVKVSVIDFTLSRMSYQGCSIFNDLSMDEDLFAAQGEYQFEIYRLMRQKVENDWQRFEPFTNVLWLHYTLDKMVTAVRYRRKGSKIHSRFLEKLRELKDTILNYESAFDFVTKCDKAVRLQGSRTSVNTVP